MASTTSFFEPTLWRKTMHRFWPLWAVYLVGWLFILPLRLLNDYFDYLRWEENLAYAQERLLDIAAEIPELLQPGVWLAAGYGLLCAMAVFGYLYNNRSAAMMHTLPLRRETLFGTQYLAGFSYFFLPHLVTALLTALVEVLFLPSACLGQALSALVTWFLVQTGISLFFFSFAAFCAMFTGHILALPAFFGILNALVIVIYGLITELMRELFYGYVPGSSTGEELVRIFTPLYALTEACSWDVVLETLPNGGAQTTEEWFLYSPGTVIGYAVSGLVLTALAMAVYRRRHIESAGDVVSVPLVRPVFKAGVAFCAGLCLGTWTALFFGWLKSHLLFTLCFLVWTAIGWFVAEMLLKKSFRVLHAWKGCLAMLAAVALLCAACSFDWFGVVGRVPKAAEVSMLTVDTRLGYPNDDGRWVDLTTADPEEVQQFIDLHHAVIRERARSEDGRYSGDEYVSISLTYTLSDGTVLRRSYNSVPLYLEEQEEEGSATWCFARLLEDRDLVAQAYNFAGCDEGRVTEAWLDNVLWTHSLDDTRTYDSVTLDDFSGQELQELWEAVKADFAAGTLGKRYLFENQERWDNTYYTDLSFTFLVNRSDDAKLLSTFTRYFTITLTPQAQNTLTWLEEHNALGGGYALAPHEHEEGKSLHTEFYNKYAPEAASVEVIAGLDN